MDIQISVRNLVEFIFRDGDIDNRHAASPDAMQDGSRIHRMIQKRMGLEYEAEVPLRYIVPYENYQIQIEGRADGVIHRENGQVIVDEIKGTYQELKHIREPKKVHLMQALCYAFIVAEKEDLREIGVRMTYCNMDTEEIKYFHETYTRVEVRNWFWNLMDQYKKWADFTYEWHQKRQESIHALAFPFAYRAGQKELVGHVYQTICHKKKLFIQAPTGVGKTISTIFPAVKAVGEEKADKIFYLTAKTITRTVAKETFSILTENGLCYKTVLLTAKEKICPMEACSCNPVDCSYAKGHFSRINDAIYALLQERDCFDRDTVLEYAERFMVCPFEMALDMSLFSDAVICDYNYLFDPYVHLKRFFAEGTKGPYLFLVDEAHNLVERGREMYSAQLVKEDFLTLKKTVKEYKTGLDKYIDRCNKELLALKKEQCDMVVESAGSFTMQLSRLHSAIGTYLEDHEDSPVREEILQFYFEAGRFLDVSERLDDHYRIYTRLREDGSFLIREYCIDPSSRLQECMDEGVASILFSATFLPIQYYKQLLGGTKEDFEVYASSAFHKEQMQLLLASDVTSRYTRRCELEYYHIASYISDIVAQRNGNYMIFFPSHQFLEQVYNCYMDRFYIEETQECITQQEYMNEAAREQFLKRFAIAEPHPDTDDRSRAASWESLVHMEIEQEDKSLLGFCVLGGIFSEGIDLKGESLIGAIIVGTGLPQVCFERELLKDYFNAEGRNGFDFAYRYPGMNKVQQAAGRVIRSETDRGIVALLDDRFLQTGYQKLFPREWQSYRCVTGATCAEAVDNFWKYTKDDK